MKTFVACGRRWPMDAHQRTAFVEGYADGNAAEAIGRPALFWVISVLVAAARYALVGVSNSDDAAAIIARLERVLRHRESDALTNAVHKHAVSLTFRGLHLDVRGNVPAPVRWIEEFLTPQLHDGSVVASRVEVRVDVDADRYAALLAEAPPRLRQIDCFTLDGSFARLHLWRGDAAGRMLHDTRAGVFIILPAALGDPPGNVDGCVVTVIVNRDTGLARLTALRVLRELATRHALRRGDVHVHGSAVVHNGRAFVFAGRKRSGKTSMLLNALRQDRTAYLSNDRVLIAPGDQGVRVRGMPTVVRVRKASLRYLPAIPSMEHQRPCASIDECESGDPSAILAEHREGEMSPAQLRRWLGVPGACVAPLGAVVFPHVDEAVGGYEIRRLDPDEACERFTRGLFNDGPAGRPPEAFAGLGGGGESSQLSLNRLIRESVCLDCRIGPRAFATPNVWPAIVKTADVR